MTGELPKGTYPKIEEKLLAEGFDSVYVWHDDPGQYYPPHAHKESVCLVVCKGSIDFEMGGVRQILLPGSTIHVPSGALHTSTAGKDGCDFVEGEKH